MTSPDRTPAAHTPEPWEPIFDPIFDVGIGARTPEGPKLVAKLPAGGTTSRADAGRIAACVNACAGIPTPTLNLLPAGTLVVLLDDALVALIEDAHPPDDLDNLSLAAGGPECP